MEWVIGSEVWAGKITAAFLIGAGALRGAEQESQLPEAHVKFIHT
jgi:hypothetical protein